MPYDEVAKPEGPTVQEIVADYEGEKSNILTSLFDLGSSRTVQESVLQELSGITTTNLPVDQYNALFARAAEEHAAGIRDALKAKYVELDLEMRAAVEERSIEVEAYLSPNSQNSGALALVIGMPEDELIQFAEIAAYSAMDDSLRLALAAARQRDLDLAEETVSQLMASEGWPDYLAEL
jgi:hypothetical protein